jgi:hypothetical protein
MAEYNLEPDKQKILGEIIDEVLTEYSKESKFFSADTLHYLRVKITNEAKKRIGEADIHSIDVILDLRHIEDIRVAFKVNIPKEKVEEHLNKQ